MALLIERSGHLATGAKAKECAGSQLVSLFDTLPADDAHRRQSVWLISNCSLVLFSISLVTDVLGLTVLT